jgi:hypothetical protein
MRRSISYLTAATLTLGFIGGIAALPADSFAQDANQEMKQVELTAADKSGMPESITEDQWMKASGEARLVSSEGGEATVEVEASGLVPDGLYTIWWVTPQTIGMDMGPAGGTPANEFTADAQGNASTTISVPAENTYGMMVVAYHADNQTHGDMPGEMGEVTFEHLMGAWPGPGGEMSDM